MSTIENYHLYNINPPKNDKSWMHKCNKICDAFNMVHIKYCINIKCIIIITNKEYIYKLGGTLVIIII